jgi:hypothetical protein
LLRWLSHRYGFGTYIHYIEGYLSRQTHVEARQTLNRLVRLADLTEGNVYVDTLICPSFTATLAQLVQLPGIGGRENNMILLECPKRHPDELAEIVENLAMIMATEFEVCILASSPRGFGYRREIHIWLRPGDYENAGLMILLAYVILDHPDWRKGIIKIFALFPEAEREQQTGRLLALIRAGRLPITPRNVEFVPQLPDADRKRLVNEKSADADLTIVGFHASRLKRSRGQFLSDFHELGNVLLVTTEKEFELAAKDEATQPVDAETEMPAAPDPANAGRDEAPANASEAVIPPRADKTFQRSPP